MEAEWHFFATCHGKGPCDGIGGTVKRIVGKASLQRTVDNHIITPLDMFKYCTENIKKIDFLFCSMQNIKEIEQQLQTRYQLAIRVPQTRSLHSFIPVSLSDLHVRITSFSEEFKVVTVNKGKPAQPQAELQPKVNDYVCCVYDNDWWLGEVLEEKIFDDNEEFRIHYFHPRGPGTCFKKSATDCDSWVLKENILKILTPSELYLTATGRSYNITSYMNEHLSTLLNEKMEK